MIKIRQLWKSLRKGTKFLSFGTVVAIIGVVIAYRQSTDTRLYDLVEAYVSQQTNLRTVEFPDSIKDNPIVRQSLQLQSHIRLYYQYVISISKTKIESRDIRLLASELQKIIDLNELGDKIRNDFLTLTIIIPGQIIHSERLLRSVDIQKISAVNDAQESFNRMLQRKYQSITTNLESGNTKRASKQICEIISSEEYYNCILAADEVYHNMFNVSNNAISEVVAYK